MLFPKEFLKGDYTWLNEATITTFTGSPSRRLFNRYNGEQVLFLINLLAAQKPGFSKEDGERMEEFIIHRVPVDAKSEMSVFAMLKDEFISNDQYKDQVERS